MNLVFNELSLDDIPKNSNEGEKLIEKFIKLYSSAIKCYKFEREVYTSIDFNQIEIATSYPISKWRNDNNIDRDIRSKFKSLCDKKECITINDDIEMDFTEMNGKIAIGALAAHINDQFLFSLYTKDLWKKISVKGNIYDVNDNSRKEVELHNVSDEKHLADNICLLKKIQKQNINKYKTTKDLLGVLDSLFPYLVFHEKSKKQLKDEVELQHLPAIKNKLCEINEYFSSWKCGNFEYKNFKSKISPQSKETLDKYKEKHTYEFEGQKILVSWHLRYTGNIAGRIYFYPNEETRKALICSLTDKLPTVSEG